MILVSSRLGNVMFGYVTFAVSYGDKPKRRVRFSVFWMYGGDVAVAKRARRVYLWWLSLVFIYILSLHPPLRPPSIS